MYIGFLNFENQTTRTIFIQFLCVKNASKFRITKISIKIVHFVRMVNSYYILSKIVQTSSKQALYWLQNGV